MIKNFLAAFLAIVILFSCSIVAFASGDDLEILPDGGYDIGDVDMDGEIRVFDATALQQHLASIIAFSQEQLELADTNFDGDVSIMDATYIQMHIAGILEIVPPTEPPTEDDDKPIELPFVPAK